MPPASLLPAGSWGVYATLDRHVSFLLVQVEEGLASERVVDFPEYFGTGQGQAFFAWVRKP